MTTTFVLERATDEMEFAVVSKWHREAGDRVTAGEPLVEIEFEKVTYDVEAPVSGVLAEVLAMEGDEVAVGDSLAVIEEG